MNTRQKLGIRGEDIAKSFLKARGYNILHQNYRYQRSEIDLIAQKEDILVIIEVKTRSGRFFGEPETAISSKKAQKICFAAEHYILQTGWQKQIRFDVISIITQPKLEIAHFEDAFY